MAKCKKIIALVIVFFFMACSGNLLAQKRKGGELSLSAVGVTVEELGLWIIPGGMIGLGINTTKAVGVELDGIIVISEGAGALMSGNVVVSPFNLKEAIPYAIGGIWTTTAGGFGWNLGGGLKIKLNENLAIRAEYRRWAVFEEFRWCVNFILCGLSLFF